MFKKDSEISIRLDHIGHLVKEHGRLLQVLDGFVHRRQSSSRVELRDSEIKSLLNATQNIGAIIKALLKDLPEEATRIIRRIGF